MEEKESGGTEVDDALKPVDLVHHDVKAPVQIVGLVLAAPDEGVALGVQLVVVVAQDVRGDEAERHGLDEFDEEPVAAYVGDDRGERGPLLLRELALEEFEELDLHALALG